MINKERLIDFFETLCKINSPSKNEKELIAYLKNFLTNLGFECWEDNAAEETGGNANNLYGLLQGNPKYRSICFNAHADTVMPTENINIIREENKIRTDGTTILGADDKAGIAIAVEAIRTVLDQNIDHGDIYILFTVQEEIGCGGANYIKTDNFKPDITFSFDTGCPTISLVTSAPKHYLMNYKIYGKAAHAAHSYDSINAISVASKAIAKIEVGMLNDDCCCNIGKISGGERFNIVPDYCEVLAEARSRDNQKADELMEKITNAFEYECEKVGAKLEKEIHCEYEAFNISENDPDFILAYNTAKSMGITPIIEKTLGGFDASIFNAKGVKAIVSSTGYEDYHTTNEFIYIDQFLTATEFAYNLIIQQTKD